TGNLDCGRWEASDSVIDWGRISLPPANPGNRAQDCREALRPRARSRSWAAGFEILPARQQAGELGLDGGVARVQGAYVDGAVRVGGGIGEACGDVALLALERLEPRGQRLELAR